MVQIPPKIKLVVDNTTRRPGSGPPKKPLKSADSPLATTGQQDGMAGDQKQPRPSPQGTRAGSDIVNLVSQENRRSLDNQPPTMDEAEQALGELARELPGTDQDVGEIHSGLDRRVILSLLAPLVSY